MKHVSTIICVLLPSTLLACGAQDKDDVFSTYKAPELVFQVHDGKPVYDPDDPNFQLSHRLLPNELEFARAEGVQEVSLHSVILMPSAFEDALLTLEFRRSDLEEAFVQGLFFKKDPKILNAHPFAQRGIEAILTDERLVLNIHSGVTFHLRNDMENAPTYETFSNPEVIAKVTQATGEIFISLDPIMTRFRLRDIYVVADTSVDMEAPGVVVEETSEGHSVITLSPEALKIPELYPPRVIEGP